jgi:hypothetical protein
VGARAPALPDILDHLMPFWAGALHRVMVAPGEQLLGWDLIIWDALGAPWY